MTIAGGAAQPVIDERRYFENPRASPDGRRMAVMVRSARDRVWAIDTARGTMSRVTTTDWQQEGHQVFSRDGRWRPTVRPSGTFDVMPDGRILFVDGRDVGGTPELRLILNWTAELRRLLPAS